jgi:hypothetical protein
MTAVLGTSSRIDSHGLQVQARAPHLHWSRQIRRRHVGSSARSCAASSSEFDLYEARGSFDRLRVAISSLNPDVFDARWAAIPVTTDSPTAHPPNDAVERHRSQQPGEGGGRDRVRRQKYLRSQSQVEPPSVASIASASVADCTRTCYLPHLTD